MKLGSRRGALFTGVLVLVCGSLTGCGNDAKTTVEKDTERSITTTVSEDKTTETMVVKTGDGGTTTFVTEGDAKTGHLNKIDGTIDVGDGQPPVKMHGKTTADGGAAMDIEMPEGVKVRTKATPDGKSRVEIDGLGGIDMETDKAGNASISTPFGKITAPK